MKMALIILGIIAIVVGLLLIIVIWPYYSGTSPQCRDAESAKQRHDQLFQQIQVAKGTDRVALTMEYENRHESVLAGMRLCEEDKVSHRKLFLVFSSVAGIGLALIISAFLFGRKKEPEQIGSIT